MAAVSFVVMNAWNQSEPIQVLCVDDNHLVADAVALKLRLAGGFVWKGHLTEANGLADSVSAEERVVILLDVDMPGRDPFNAMRELVERGTESRVIAFSGHVRTELVDRAITAGAWGYISKNDGEDALIEGIRSVAAGEFALSPEVRAIYERG